MDKLPSVLESRKSLNETLEHNADFKDYCDKIAALIKTAIGHLRVYSDITSRLLYHSTTILLS